MKKYITKEEYFHMCKNFNKITHWNTYENRWDYHEQTINLLEKINFNTVLEAGTMGINVFKNSDTIDIQTKRWKLLYKPTYLHDLQIIPWPIKNKQYDVFIALRVFHHLIDKPEKYLNEMKRISNHIILSMPENKSTIYEKIEKPKKRIICKSIREKSPNTILIYYEV